MNQEPTTPFLASYWVIPGKLLAGQYPSSPDPDEAGHKLRALAACGIQRVINLMEEHEVNHLGQPFTRYQEPLIELGAQNNRMVECSRYPIRDMSTPTAEWMVQILDEIDRSLAAGQAVYVHCWGGIGRTGTVIGCFLARHGLAKGEAALELLAELRRNVRPWRSSPETDEQRKMVCSWPVNQ